MRRKKGNFFLVTKAPVVIIEINFTARLEFLLGFTCNPNH